MAKKMPATCEFTTIAAHFWHLWQHVMAGPRPQSARVAYIIWHPCVSNHTFPQHEGSALVGPFFADLKSCHGARADSVPAGTHSAVSCKRSLRALRQPEWPEYSEGARQISHVLDQICKLLLRPAHFKRTCKRRLVQFFPEAIERGEF